MKIDVSKISGFDGMTAEEKVAALLGLDVPEEVDLSKFVSKETADKYASEAAELKKQLRSKQSEEEVKKMEEEAERKALEDKYNQLLERTTIAENKSKYLSLGMTISWPRIPQRLCTPVIWKRCLPTAQSIRPSLRRRSRRMF